MMYQAADGQPVLVVASGANRVDEKKVAALLGQKIKRADPEFVLVSTGVAVGGVPPIGHVAPLTFLSSGPRSGINDLGRGPDRQTLCSP